MACSFHLLELLFIFRRLSGFLSSSFSSLSFSFIILFKSFFAVAYLFFFLMNGLVLIRSRSSYNFFKRLLGGPRTPSLYFILLGF